MFLTYCKLYTNAINTVDLKFCCLFVKLFWVWMDILCCILDCLFHFTCATVRPFWEAIPLVDCLGLHCYVLHSNQANCFKLSVRHVMWPKSVLILQLCYCYVPLTIPCCLWQSVFEFGSTFLQQKQICSLLLKFKKMCTRADCIVFQLLFAEKSRPCAGCKVGCKPKFLTLGCAEQWTYSC